jgi:hypothetical protein
MAWAFVASRGTAVGKADSTTQTLSPSAALPAGAVAALYVVWDNFDGTPDDADEINLSVTDTQGNTWTRLKEWQCATTSALTGVDVAIFVSKLATALATSDTITVTNAVASPGTTAKGMGLAEFSVAAGKTWEKDSESASHASHGGTTVTSGTISGRPSQEYLCLGFAASEDNVANGQDADYTLISSFVTSGGAFAVNVAGRAQYRIAILTGDTFNGSVLGNDHVGMLILVKEVDEGGVAYSRTVTDALGLLDSRDQVGVTKREVTDGLGMADPTARVHGAIREATDSLGLLDPMTASIVLKSEITDPLGFLDSRAMTMGHGRVLTDPLGLVDSQAQMVIARRTIIDVLGLLDPRVVAAAYFRSQTDSLGLVDQATYVQAAPITRAITDALGLQDSRSFVVGYRRAVIDLLGLRDSESVFPPPIPQGVPWRIGRGRVFDSKKGGTVAGRDFQEAIQDEQGQ